MPSLKASSAMGVGRKLRSIDSAFHHASNLSGSRAVALEANNSVAPTHSGGQISQVEASNPNPATQEERLPGFSLNPSQCQKIKLTRLWCSTMTPLGRPMDPEV